MIILFSSIFAGFLGALLGLGGGIIIVPVLTLFYGVDIHHAVAISLISIVSTSVAAAGNLTKENLTNMRVGVFLLVATVTGAVSGFFISHKIGQSILFIIFGLFLLVSALMMLRKRNEQLVFTSHPIAVKLKLHTENYQVDRPLHGFLAMYFAGLISALLGIGSGSLKVLAMDGFMRLPIKVSSATSNFMIGITAATSAVAYLVHGDVMPMYAAPVAIGMTIGSWFGSQALAKFADRWIRVLFVIVLLVTSIQMIVKGFAK